MREDARKLAQEYAEALTERGDTPRGVGYPNIPDVATRFEVLLQPIDFQYFTPSNRVRLLDLGCGPGFLLDYLGQNGLLDSVDYTGVDVTEASIESALRRWPRHRFEHRDVRDQPFPPAAFDCVIACGAFASRCSLSFEEMEILVKATLQAIWPSVEVGIGFNVMSKHVDWERDDLFHWPLDDIMAFCKAHLSRHAAFRLDYDLWEVAALVRREPVPRRTQIPERWTVPLPPPLSDEQSRG